MIINSRLFLCLFFIFFGCEFSYCVNQNPSPHDVDAWREAIHVQYPLWRAIKNCDIQGVDNLIDELGIDINKKLAGGAYLLSNSIYQYVENKPNSMALIMMLLNRGASLIGIDAIRDPILEIIKYDQIELLKHLVKMKKYNLNDINLDGNTILHLAVAEGSFQMCEYILSRIFDSHVQGWIDGTPIEIAIKKNKANIVELFIKNGQFSFIFDAFYFSFKHESYIHLAVEYGSKEVVEVLLKNHFSKNRTNIFDETPYDLAIRKGFNKIALLLN